MCGSYGSSSCAHINLVCVFSLCLRVFVNAHVSRSFATQMCNYLCDCVPCVHASSAFCSAHRHRNASVRRIVVLYIVHKLHVKHTVI